MPGFFLSASRTGTSNASSLMDRGMKMKYTSLKVFPAERGKSRFFSAVLNRFSASFCITCLETGKRLQRWLFPQFAKEMPLYQV
jgi:hypothetical protein